MILSCALPKHPRLCIPKWSDRIIDETVRTLETRRERSPEQTGQLVAVMKEAFPEAWVCGYQSLEDSLENHMEDRHVLAAAIRCRAQAIVTFNLKDSSKEALANFNIEAVHPDEFLVDQFHLDDTLFDPQLHRQATAINRTVEQQLRSFERFLPVFSQTLADALSIDLSTGGLNP